MSLSYVKILDSLKMFRWELVDILQMFHLFPGDWEIQAGCLSVSFLWNSQPVFLVKQWFK